MQSSNALAPVVVPSLMPPALCRKPLATTPLAAAPLAAVRPPRRLGSLPPYLLLTVPRARRGRGMAVHHAGGGGGSLAVGECGSRRGHATFMVDGADDI